MTTHPESKMRKISFYGFATVPGLLYFIPAFIYMKNYPDQLVLGGPVVPSAIILLAFLLQVFASAIEYNQPDWEFRQLSLTIASGFLEGSIGLYTLTLAQHWYDNPSNGQIEPLIVSAALVLAILQGIKKIIP